MWKTLAIKELRETAGIALIGLLAGFYVLGGLTGLPLPPINAQYLIPFVSPGSIFPFLLIGVALAVALGLWQTVGELFHNTFLFLLHRPARREMMLAVKLLSGLIWFVLGMAIPVFLYAWWAATPGNHASPFEWAMTLPVLKTMAVLTVVYLSAFLSGLRPGSWFGTRLLPLAGGGFLAVMVYIVPWSWGLGLLLLLVVDALLVQTIFSVADQRDF